MTIRVNNEDLQTAASSVAGLVAELGLPTQGVAVAINNTLVPRNTWEEQPLTEGANITIIKAACGG